LPLDIKQRELYLLFRSYEGYEGSIVRITSKAGKPPAPVGFVTFTSRATADKARLSLQGVKFDPFDSIPLRLEFARANTKAKFNPWSNNSGNNYNGQLNWSSNSSMVGGTNGNFIQPAAPATILGRQIGDFVGGNMVAATISNAAEGQFDGQGVIQHVPAYVPVPAMQSFRKIQKII